MKIKHFLICSFALLALTTSACAEKNDLYLHVQASKGLDKYGITTDRLCSAFSGLVKEIVKPDAVVKTKCVAGYPKNEADKHLPYGGVIVFLKPKDSYHQKALQDYVLVSTESKQSYANPVHLAATRSLFFPATDDVAAFKQDYEPALKALLGEIIKAHFPERLVTPESQ